jgi:hypothetical protein
LKELGLYEKTLIYVVVDHGFNEDSTGHRYAPFVFVGTNDKQITRKAGAREDIAATVLERFGVDLAKLNPALDGIPLDEPAPDRFAPPDNPVAPKAKRTGKKAKRGKVRSRDSYVKGEGRLPTLAYSRKKKEFREWLNERNLLIANNLEARVGIGHFPPRLRAQYGWILLGIQTDRPARGS